MHIKDIATGRTGIRGKNELALTGPAQGVYPVEWDDGESGFAREGTYVVIE
jgi:hypothetical protein